MTRGPSHAPEPAAGTGAALLPKGPRGPWPSAGRALLAGAVASLPFVPVTGAAWLMPWALIPFVRVVAAAVADGGRFWRLWRDGALLGLGFNLALYHWIPFLDPVNLTMPWIMLPTLFLMAGYLTLWTLGAVLTAGLVCRGRPGRLVWAFPAAWTVWEWFRGLGDMGFSWGALAHALAPAPITYQFADLVGVFGVTFVLVAVATRLALPTRRRVVEAGTALLLILVYGAVRMSAEPPAGSPTLNVGVIQPNLGPAEKWVRENRDTIFAKYLRQSTALSGSDLIVWPESATPFRLLDNRVHLRAVRDLARANNATILTGTPHVDRFAVGDSIGYTHHNAAVVIPPAGDLTVYRKQWLVPFSEWIPWKWLRLMEVNFGQADFRPGTDSTPVQVGEHRAGVLICIEAVFPRFARRSVRAGADCLVNITNDAWFGDSAAPIQHAATARFRAVETRRPVVRCANTGISFIVDRAGRVGPRLGTFVEGEIHGLIVPETSTTMYVRFGDWFVGVAALMCLGTLAVGLRDRRPRPDVASRSSS